MNSDRYLVHGICDYRGIGNPNATCNGNFDGVRFTKVGKKFVSIMKREDGWEDGYAMMNLARGWTSQLAVVINGPWLVRIERERDMIWGE